MKNTQVISATILLQNLLKTSTRKFNNGTIARNLQNTEADLDILANKTGRNQKARNAVELFENSTERSKNMSVEILNLGPHTDIMKHASRPDETVAADAGPVIVMADPNASMWNLSNEINGSKAAVKKVKYKFKKLKENIHDYYLGRVEETEEMLKQIEKPFVIGKRATKQISYRKLDRLEGVSIEPLKGQISKLHLSKAGKPGYKANKPSYIQNTEILMNNEIGENICNKTIPQEISQFAEIETNLPEKEELKFNETINYVKEGISDVDGGVSVPINSKTLSEIPIRNSIIAKIHNPLTNFSMNTLNNYRTFSTSTVKNNKCLPGQMAPESLVCDPDYKLPKCPKPESYKWPCCPRITVCGCNPPHPRSFKPNCGKEDFIVLFPFVKKPDYICPSFSECLCNTELIKERPHECCMKKKPCEIIVDGSKKQFTTAIERQEISLGQKYWTGQKEPKCFYHSSVRIFNNKTCFEPPKGFCCPKKKDEDEEQLCMKLKCISGNRKKDKFRNTCSLDECEKICLPCCEPSREPPTCQSAFKIKSCKKKRNPAPSFSECEKKDTSKTEICECLIPIKPKCKTVDQST